MCHISHWYVSMIFGIRWCNYDAWIRLMHLMRASDSWYFLSVLLDSLVLIWAVQQVCTHSSSVHGSDSTLFRLLNLSKKNWLYRALISINRWNCKQLMSVNTAYVFDLNTFMQHGEKVANQTWQMYSVSWCPSSLHMKMKWLLVQCWAGPEGKARNLSSLTCHDVNIVDARKWKSLAHTSCSG